MNALAPNLRKVLCALDVTRATGAPLSMAHSISGAFDASVDVVYAAARFQMFGGRAERMRRLICEHNARELLGAILAPYAAVSARLNTFVTAGSPGPVIMGHAELHRTDLIVLGASTRAAERSGGVSGPVVSASRCAVLTVPERTGSESLARILLPTSEFLAGERAITWAIALAARFGARIEVVEVEASERFWSRWGRNAVAVDAGRSERSGFAAEALMKRLRSSGVAAELYPRAVSAEEALQLAPEFDLVVTGLRPQRAAVDAGERFVRALRQRGEVAVLSAREPGESFAASPLWFVPSATAAGELAFAISA